MNEKFIHTPKLKMMSFICMGIGLLALLGGLLAYKDDVTRIWANLLLDSVFLLGIVMASAFFLAATYVAWGGWHVLIKRIPEAISAFMPFAVLILFVVLIGSGDHLYEWRNKALVDQDEIVKGKMPYFNQIFYWGRFVFFLGALITLNYLIRRRSIMEDSATPGDLVNYKKSVDYASGFLVFFAVYISVSAWDWLMSLDIHWYSTMYGWYVFASFWVTGLSVIALFFIFLKTKGYLKDANENHLHDIGTLMFAFSVFWTYVTFSQFMLIWYANIPDETVYFKMRFEHYRIWFYLIFIMNFALPLLILMSRDAKRSKAVVAVAAIIIILGHFIDFWLMIYPAVTNSSVTYPGWFELGVPFLFFGLFTYVVFNYMSKYNLVPVNHPNLNESLQHSI